MRQGLKITTSLLIALLVFGAFAVVSFTGLFNVLETAFFRPRVVSARENDAEKYATAIEAYHNANIERFSSAAAEPFVISVFRANQSQKDIFDRENYFGKLLEDFPYLEAVRIVGPGGDKLHFSTIPTDLSPVGSTQRKYQDLSEVDETLSPEDLRVSTDSPPRLIIDARSRRFVYVFPVAAETYLGAAVFYIAKSGVSDTLLNMPDFDFRGLLLVDRLGVVINPPFRSDALVAEAVVSLWERGAVEPPVETVVLQDGVGVEERYGVISRQAGRFGYVGTLLPFSTFELQPLMKAVLLASVFLTVFLLVFLLFNLRQDPLLVLSQRIKRFQLEILQEFIDGKERIDWQRWRREMISNRGELKSRIKRGIGRLPSDREAELDGLIDKSWDEIISIIEARLGEARPAPIDLRAIEQMLQRALERGSVSITAQAESAPRRTLAQPSEPAQKLVVEEIGIEEVVEVSSPESMAGTREPREVSAEAEAVEEVELVEEAEEAEVGETLEEAELAEEAEMIPEAVEEVEAIEELEEAEAVEEPAEIQAVEDVEAVEELEALEAVEELEEAEAIEEPGAVESLEEAEEIEEAAEAEIAEQLRAMASTTPADTPMRPQQTTEKPAPATELEERIQELEAVKEMTTLPPLPQEDLEELPEAPKVAVKHPKGPKRAARATPPGEDVGRKKVPVQKAEEKLEELKEPEAAGDTAQALQRAGAAAKAPSAQRHFEILLKRGKIQSFTLAEMEQRIIENRTSVVMENGVYRVKQELYGDTQGKKRAMGLKALAESVLSAQAEEESGIGTLFGEDVLLDFDKDLGASSSGGVELLLGGRQRAKKIQFFENGLDYDSYLGGFGAGKSVTRRLKSLVELSGKLKAVNAAIFSKQDKRLRLAFKVGLLDDPSVIEFAEGEYLYNAFLSPRKTVLIRERPELIEGLGRKFNPDDLRYLQAAVLIPIIYEDRESYLYMGLPDEKYCELDHLITRLDIY